MTGRNDIIHTDVPCQRTKALAERAWQNVTEGLADIHQGRRKQVLKLFAARLRYKSLLYPDHAHTFLAKAICFEALAIEACETEFVGPNALCVRAEDDVAVLAVG